MKRRQARIRQAWLRIFVWAFILVFAFSIVGGHEYEEAQTDPGAGSGWTDATGYEDGDKCAWNALSSNITLGSNYYAAQPVWSNAIGGCTMG